MRTRNGARGIFTDHARLGDFVGGDEYGIIRQNGLDGVYVVSGHPDDIGSGITDARVYKIGKWTKNKHRLNQYRTVWREEDTVIHYLWPNRPHRDQGVPVANRKENALRAILKRDPEARQVGCTRDYFHCTWKVMRRAILQMEKEYRQAEHKGTRRTSERLRDQRLLSYERGVTDVVSILGRPLSKRQMQVLAERKAAVCA